MYTQMHPTLLYYPVYITPDNFIWQGERLPHVHEEVIIIIHQTDLRVNQDVVAGPMNSEICPKMAELVQWITSLDERVIRHKS
jgi:hypothetical protein